MNGVAEPSLEHGNGYASFKFLWIAFIEKKREGQICHRTRHRSEWKVKRHIEVDRDV